MAKRNSILVVIDPTNEIQPAMARAVDFAKHLGADLELFGCIFDADIAHVQWVTGQRLEHLRTAAIDEFFEVLEKLAEPLRSAGLSVTCKVAWDSPLHEAIVREALRIDADFVVKDTHYHWTIARTLLTNTDWHLIRECPCALWLVKPELATEPEHATVMAAVDPTHEHDQTAALDHRIVQTAQLIGTMLEERIHLVHVFEPPPPPATGIFPVASPAPDPRLVAEARAAHAKALQTFAADGGFPADQVHIREGNQVNELPKAAGELTAGVVVMGAIARSMWQRAIVGRTAEKTLDRFPCDVVVVKPDGFESPVESIPPIYGYAEKSE